MKIGFVGLGAMGGPMALNLLAAGYDLRVFARRPKNAKQVLENGAVRVDSLKQLSECDVLFTSLPGPPEVEEVFYGGEELARTLRPGSIYVDLSTNSPQLIRRIFADLKQRGVGMLDAPVSGGPKGAKSKKLAIWTSGDAASFERCKPLLSAIGDQVRFLGDAGTATIAKLVHNCANYTINIALAEAFTLGVKAGVDPLALFAAVRQGSLGRQSTMDRMADHFLANNYDDPSFALALAHKDVGLATELAREHNVPMRLANIAFADMTEAMNLGWGARDSRSPMKIQERRAAVDIAVPREKLIELQQREPLDRR
jgi:3-hydroxyisobutyrate dehydrogenase-like beta-hydroxyacid dehydrogenase